jgi:hypothetical protein
MGENFTDVKCFFFISYRYISLILKLFAIKDVNIDENKIVLLEKYVMFAKKDITYKVTAFYILFLCFF